MNYIVSIEGQSIPVPEKIALDDANVKAALAPIFPGAANAKIMRSEPNGDTVTITVVKQAGTKGAESAGVDLERVHDLLQTLQSLPAGVNAAIGTWRQIQEKDLLFSEISPEDLLELDEAVKAAMENGKRENDAINNALLLLAETQPQPLSSVPGGF